MLHRYHLNTLTNQDCYKEQSQERRQHHALTHTTDTADDSRTNCRRRLRCCCCCFCCCCCCRTPKYRHVQPHGGTEGRMPAVRGRDDEHVVAGNGPSGDTHRAHLLVDAEAGGGIVADGQRVADGRVDADVSVGRVHRRYRPLGRRLVLAQCQVVLTEGKRRAVVVDVGDCDEHLGERRTARHTWYRRMKSGK